MSSPKPHTDQERLQQAAAFRTALRHYLAKTETATTRAGITPQRYDLLLLIKTAADDHEGATIGSLCEGLALKQPAVSELVKRAEQAGMIERTRSRKDGRVSHFQLTPEGESRVLEVFQALTDNRAAFIEAFRHLDDDAPSP